METGPPVTILTDWLAGIPGDFLKDPLMLIEGDGGVNRKGEIDVPAVIADLIFDAGGGFPPEEDLTWFEKKLTKQNREHLGLILILCHLLHQKWFLDEKRFSQKMLSLLKSRNLAKLSKTVPCKDFITEPDRREELVRLALFELGLVPEGESETSALDRLTTLDSVERERIIRKTKKSREKARKLREAMKRKEAEEAASKWTRE